MNYEPPPSTPQPVEDARQGTPPQQPVRISVPQSAPYVTYSIIGVTIFVFILQLISLSIFGSFSNSADILQAYGALIGSAVRAGELWRLVTPVLLHSNNFFLHILFNMYTLYILGNNLERHFGHGRFLLLYLLGGFSGNVLSFLFLGDGAYSVGASTAIFGLIGAEGIFLYQNRKLFAGQFRGAIGNVIFFILFNLFVVGSLPNIDNWGHIGGLLGGLIFSWFAGPVWEVEGIPPMLQLVDRRELREVLTGAATVLFIFGALAMWGMVR